MAVNAAAAIVSWRDHLEEHGGGLSTFEQSYTVSTMLFGCHQWLNRHGEGASLAEVTRITEIKHELEEWMATRKLAFNG